MFVTIFASVCIDAAKKDATRKRNRLRSPWGILSSSWQSSSNCTGKTRLSVDDRSSNRHQGPRGFPARFAQCACELGVRAAPGFHGIPPHCQSLVSPWMRHALHTCANQRLLRRKKRRGSLWLERGRCNECKTAFSFPFTESISRDGGSVGSDRNQPCGLLTPGACRPRSHGARHALRPSLPRVSTHTVSHSTSTIGPSRRRRARQLF